MRNISKPGSLHSDATRFEQQLLEVVRRIGMRDPLAAECDVDGLTPPQIHALYWLGHDGPLTMGELARRGGITEKTITGVVDRLETAGMLKRIRDEADRRVIRVHLSDKGATSFERLRVHVVTRLEALFRVLDADDRAAVFRIIEKLQRRFSEASASEARLIGSGKKG